jgi:hypothetical protein
MGKVRYRGAPQAYFPSRMVQELSAYFPHHGRANQNTPISHSHIPITHGAGIIRIFPAPWKGKLDTPISHSHIPITHGAGIIRIFPAPWKGKLEHPISHSHKHHLQWHASINSSVCADQ